MYAHTHTHTRARAHTHTHTLSLTRTRIYIYAYISTYVHIYRYARIATVAVGDPENIQVRTLLTLLEQKIQSTDTLLGGRCML